MNKLFRKKIFWLLLLGIVTSGCITNHYKDDLGRDCARTTKWYILFIKSSYACQPLSESAPQ